MGRQKKKGGAVKLGAVAGLIAAGIYKGVLPIPDLPGSSTLAEASAMPPAASVADIPADYMGYYRAYGGMCPHLDWALLAGIGSIETSHGKSQLPGVHSGANSAGAAGPTQFLPSTFAGVRERHPDVGPDQYDPATAVKATAHKLCDDGVAAGNTWSAVYAYNHAGWYVDEVLAKAAAYRAAA
jgi:hypothetical protein